MQEIVAKLTAKDDKYACAIADKIISESQDTDEWYEYFDTFASLLNHPKSLVRSIFLPLMHNGTMKIVLMRFLMIILPMLRMKNRLQPDSALRLSHK